MLMRGIAPLLYRLNRDHNYVADQAAFHNRITIISRVIDAPTGKRQTTGKDTGSVPVPKPVLAYLDYIPILRERQTARGLWLRWGARQVYRVRWPSGCTRHPPCGSVCGFQVLFWINILSIFSLASGPKTAPRGPPPFLKVRILRQGFGRSGPGFGGGPARPAPKTPSPAPELTGTPAVSMDGP